LLLFLSLQTSYLEFHGSYSTVTTLWAAWLYFYISAVEKNSTWRYVLSFITASLALYLHELSFALFAPASFLLLLFNSRPLTKKEKVFHVAILAQVVIFLTVFYFVVFLSANHLYGAGKSTFTRFGIFFNHIKRRPILLVAGILAILRLIFILTARKIKISVADTLLAGGLAWCLAFVVIRFDEDYYLYTGCILLFVAVGLYCHQAWLYVFVKYPAAFDAQRSGFKYYARAGVCVLVVLLALYRPYKKALAEPEIERNNRFYTYQTVNALSELRRRGYTLCMYLPPLESFHDNSYQYYVNHWYWIILNRFISYYNNEPAYEVKKYSDAQSLAHDFNDTSKSVALILAPNAAHNNDIASDVLEAHTLFLYWYTVKLSQARDLNVTLSLSLFNPIVYSQGKLLSSPDGLMHAVGFSLPEGWGSWSDGPKLIIFFDGYYDKPFTLKLNVVHVFMENLKEPLRISAGDDEKELRISGPGEYSIVITPVQPASSLTIDIPATVSPKDLGINQETRKLGIGLSSITIVPNAE
jgi:hypothetical protein